MHHAAYISSVLLSRYLSHVQLRHWTCNKVSSHPTLPLLWLLSHLFWSLGVCAQEFHLLFIFALGALFSIIVVVE